MTDARELLRKAGWVPGRRVEVTDALTELGEAGHHVVAPAREILAEYSGLVVMSVDGRRSINIDGRVAARSADLGWCEAYAEGIGRAVTPVGEYSHMTLVIDEAGAFWGGFDADYGFMGDDIADVVHGLLIEPGLRRLDREVAD